MTATNTLLAAVAALGIALVGSQLVGGMSAANAAIDTNGSRWSDAFGDGRLGPVLHTAAAAKSDRLPMSAGCAAQDWPNIASTCLVSSDGRAVRSASRSVTTEYRVGENTSVLVRSPLAQVAAN